MLGVRQYAAHRGVSPAAVSKAIKDGRLSESIIRDERGHPKIKNAKQADKEWARKTGLPRGKPRPGHRPGEEDVPGYLESRARRESALAGLATLELDRERGELVTAKGVHGAVASAFSEVRTKLLGVPTSLRLHSSTISEPDLKMVDDFIREALEALADGAISG